MISRSHAHLPHRRLSPGRPPKYNWQNADKVLLEELSKGHEFIGADNLAQFLRMNAINENGEMPTRKQTKFYAKKKYLQIYEDAKAIRENWEKHLAMARVRKPKKHYRQK